MIQLAIIKIKSALAYQSPYQLHIDKNNFIHSNGKLIFDQHFHSTKTITANTEHG